MDGEELLARLNGSPEGERVARTFFEDPELDKEQLNLAIRARGVLDTAEDALDRMLPVGAFLRGHDAYFSYPGATHETGQPGPPLTPGTVMSLLKVEGSVTSRIDAVPRGQEALERYAHEVLLQSTPDEKGARAAQLLQAALNSGERLHELSEGIEVTLKQAPPAFEPLVGHTTSDGTLALGPAEPALAPPRRRITLAYKRRAPRAPKPLTSGCYLLRRLPAGFDGALVGSAGALEVEALFRQVPGGGQMAKLHYRADGFTLRERVAALRFLRAAVEGGEVVITDRGPTKRPPLRQDLDRAKALSTDAFTVLSFLEDLLVISEWTGVELDVPELVDYQAAYTVAVVANMISQAGPTGEVEHFETTVDSEGLARLRAGGQLLVDRTLAARINDQLLQLGFTRIHIESYKLVAATEQADGTHTVRIEPASEEGAEVFGSSTKSRKPLRSASGLLLPRVRGRSAASRQTPPALATLPRAPTPRLLWTP